MGSHSSPVGACDSLGIHDFIAKFIPRPYLITCFTDRLTTNVDPGGREKNKNKTMNLVKNVMKRNHKPPKVPLA